MVFVVAVVPMLLTGWNLIVSKFWPQPSPKVVEAFPLREVLAYSEYRISDLRRLLRNLSCWKANGTFVFIPFKEPLPAYKDGARLVVRNITIALREWPVKRLSQHISIGFWTDKPLMLQTVGEVTIATCYANVWIGVVKGFNDIKPPSRVFTFDLDSALTRTGGSRGKFGEAKIIGIVIIALTRIENYNIEYVDFTHAYIAYVEG